MIKEKIIKYSIGALRIIIAIGLILGIIFFFRWTGYKGMIAFILGMGLMAYLLLSKNIAIKMLVDHFGSTEYINELSEKDLNNLKKKGLKNIKNIKNVSEV